MKSHHWVISDGLQIGQAHNFFSPLKESESIMGYLFIYFYKFQNFHSAKDVLLSVCFFNLLFIYLCRLCWLRIATMGTHIF